jgi:two-component system, NtrC family, sensor kinase
MHIKEPATQQLAVSLSPQGAQAFIDQEQLQQAQANLEICGFRSQMALQTALAANGLGLWDWNLVSEQIYYDPQWKRILGYEVEENTNQYQYAEQLVHPEDLLRVRTALNDYLEGRRPVYEVELRMRTKSGEWKWIFATGKISYSDESGKPVWMSGTHKDITREKRIEEALQQRFTRERLFKTVRDRIYSSRRLKPVLQTAVQQVQHFLHADRVIIYQFHPDGSGEAAFESVTAPFASLQGLDIQNSCFWSTDITLYQQSGILAQSNIKCANLNAYQIDLLSQFQIKANLIVPILVRVEADGGEAKESSIQHRLWGLLIVHGCRNCRPWQEWEIESLKELSIELAIAIGQNQLFQQLQKEISEHQSTQTQAKEKSQQLEITQAQLQTAQEQLLQNEKMANLGQLVTDMANEIYNPVNFVNSTLHPASQYAEDLIKLIELYQHYYPTPTPAIALQLQRLNIDFVKTDFLKLLWSMRAATERIKDHVFALQHFSRFDDGQIRKVDLHEGFNSVLRILQHRLKEQPDRPGIQVIKEFGDLPLVECYPCELNQVFMNILTNAVDALEERMKYDYSFTPQIYIRTETISSHLSLVSSNELRTIGQGTAKKQKILIHIYDNGKGILPHIKRRIFEPFFTTKPKGKGKGLGLSISEQIIVEKHQGRLKCNSQLGEGTELIIEMNAAVKTYIGIKKHARF